jgi:tRNA uridine 5-carbamoylmethylation protein Kti12
MFVIKVPLNLAISRNDERNKNGKETVEEIIERYDEFEKVTYYSKRTVKIKNEGSINQGIKKILNELY